MRCNYDFITKTLHASTPQHFYLIRHFEIIIIYFLSFFSVHKQKIKKSR